MFGATKAEYMAEMDEKDARITELEVMLRDLIEWRDTGEVRPAVWARARAVLRKSKVNG